MLLDTHFHLDFVEDASERSRLVSELSARDVGVVAQTLLPSAFVAQTFPPHALPSLGFHPWQITESADQELAIFADAVVSTRFVGEIGLDFSPRRLAQAPAELQERVLRTILELVCEQATASQEPYVLSIHAVRSATAALDLLAEFPEQNVVPIIHWFSGTSDELMRLIQLGGYISVNPHMLESKRGRAYVKQVPADRLLLETDLPESESSEANCVAEEIIESLQSTLAKLTELRGIGMQQDIERNQQRLFGALAARTK